MSAGLVMCSACHREVHQRMFTHEWYHCEDGTPRCKGATSVYATREQIVGRACFADDPDPPHRSAS